MPPRSNVDIVVSAIDRIAAPMRRINRSIDSMAAPVRRVRGALRALATEAHLPKIANAARFVGRQLRSASYAAAAGVAALAAGVNHLINSGDKIAKTADRIGIGIEALQEFRFAADRGGVSFDELDKGLEKGIRSIGDLKAGSGALFTLLRRSGTSGDALLKQLQTIENSEEAINLLFESISRIPDPTRRASFAAAAFGRQGLKMSNIVKDGFGDLQALRVEFRTLGAVMSERAARDAEVAQDSVTNLMTAVRGLGVAVGSSLIPHVTTYADKMTEWVVANREWLAQDISKKILEIGEVARGSLPVVIDFLKALQPIVEAGGGIVRMFTKTPRRELRFDPIDSVNPFFDLDQSMRHAGFEERQQRLERALLAGQRVQSDFAGKLDIHVSAEGRPRVTRLESNRRDFDLGVETGLVLGTY